MKKLLLLLALMLCCLSFLSSCENTPYEFYVNRAVKIEPECKEYSLKPVGEIKDGETYRAITSSDYVSRDYLFNPDNDGGDDKEFFNENGLYVYMYNRKLHVFYKDSLYDLDADYFREHSPSFNAIESIWSARYDVKPTDIANLIVGAAVFDGNIFVLAQNEQTAQLAFDREHTANLWRFDYLTGKVEFCGFCVTRSGISRDLHFFGNNDFAIVKS